MIQKERGVSALSIVLIVVIAGAVIGGTAYVVTRPKPNIQIKELTVSQEKVPEGEPVTVEVEIINRGGARGSKTISLQIEGKVMDNYEVTLSPGETDTVTFKVAMEKVGSYDLSVGSLSETIEILEPAKFEVSDLKLSSSRVEVGKPIDVSVDVSNIGDLSGEYTVSLEINEEIENTRVVTLDGGETSTVTFMVSKRNAQTYNVKVNGVTGSFKVLAPGVVPPENRFVGAELLVLVSPQYNQSSEIFTAIDKYRDAVKSDIGWDTEIVTLTNTTNSVGNIRQIIKEKFQSDGIYATLVIGEDTDTALSADCRNKDSPSVELWSAFNDEILWSPSSNNTISLPPTATPQQIDNLLARPGQVVLHTATPQVAVALLYPTSTNSYDTKVTQIVSALSKFTTSHVENFDYGNKIRFFVDVCTHFDNEFVKDCSKNYNMLGEVTCSPTIVHDATSLYGSKIKLLGSFGHGNPRWANGLKPSDLKNIDVPLLAVEGCYTEGWFTLEEEEDSFDPPEVTGWFGELAITHPSINAVVAGIPLGVRARWDNYPPVKNACNFMWYGWKGLSENKTLAEAILKPVFDIVYIDQQVIYGDPTFHYGRYQAV